MTNTFRRLFTGSAIALSLTIGSVGSIAFADTPQGNLDAAIAEAQQTLGQISFEGAADPDALRKKLADMLARVAKCEVGLLRDIKNALAGFLQSSAFDPLHDLINSADMLTPEEDFFREIAKRLFGGALKKDLENADSLGLFSSLERALAQDWHPPRDSSDVIKKMFDPLWDKALAGAVGKGKLGAAIRQLALVRKLLAQMANIRVLHAKAYPAKSAPPTSGGKVLTPPKAPMTSFVKVRNHATLASGKLLITARNGTLVTSRQLTFELPNQRIVVTPQSKRVYKHTLISVRPPTTPGALSLAVFPKALKMKIAKEFGVKNVNLDDYEITLVLNSADENDGGRLVGDGIAKTYAGGALRVGKDGNIYVDVPYNDLTELLTYIEFKIRIKKGNRIVENPQFVFKNPTVVEQAPPRPFVSPPF